MKTRRQTLQDAARLAAAAAIAPLLIARAADASTTDARVNATIRLIAALNRRLRRGGASPLAWQAEIEDLLATVPLEELVAAIDLERVLRGFRFPPDRAGMRKLRLPGKEGRTVDAAVFGLRRGRAIPPHAHNNVAAAHLVLDGELRVRTFQRRADAGDALVLEPVRDTVLGRGDVLSVSDDEENAHWLVGVSERAVTLDVPLQRVRPGKRYDAKAQGAGMIFLDPDRGEPDGARVRVPIIDAIQGVRRYGRRRENLARAVVVDKPDRRVAITIDDLPWVGPRSRGVAANLARLVTTLDERRVPAHGFVCGRRGSLSTLAGWRAAGLPLGDHTFSHRAFSKITWAELMADVRQNEEAVRAALDHRLRDDGWFRLPFLDHGHTPAKVARLSAWLRETDRRLAHVSFDTVDYLFAKRYPATSDRDAVAALFVEHVAECAQHFEGLSRTLFGREIPLVLLLHANELTCERIGDVLDALSARGYRAVSLDDACSDGAYRAYRTRPPLVPRRGDRNLLTQVAHARGLAVEDKSGGAWFRTNYLPRFPPERETVSP